MSTIMHQKQCFNPLEVFSLLVSQHYEVGEISFLFFTVRKFVYRKVE